jgi:uncharacterized protein YkwD
MRTGSPAKAWPLKALLPQRSILSLCLALACLALAAQSPAQARPAIAFENYGFEALHGPGPGSLEGQDLSGQVRRLDLSGQRLIVIYAFRPAQTGARQSLAALEKLRLDYEGRLIVAAAAPDSAAAIAAAVSGLGLRFPLLSKPGVEQALGLPSSPAFLILAPGGGALARRLGAYDLSSVPARKMVDALLAAHPAATAEARPAAASTIAGFLSPVEAGVVAELNLARENPRGYADYLREYRSMIHGGIYERPGEIGIRLQEGTRAVDEAIAFLEKQSPLLPLSPSRGMSAAASVHAADQGKSGATGHTGRDGSSPFDRMNRFGKWAGTAGENISYGADDARGIVIQLLVDDGVASRGHRANIFNPAFRTVGIAVGPHPGYGSLCVQDFAAEYRERGE